MAQRKDIIKIQESFDEKSELLEFVDNYRELTGNELQRHLELNKTKKFFKVKKSKIENLKNLCLFSDN